MIPTHQSERTNRSEIIVNHLSQLNEYDFTEPHRHDYFEFFYFIRGGGIHRIDFIDFPICDNSVHIVAPGQVHQMMRELDSEGFVFLFGLEALEAPVLIEEFLFEHTCMDATERSPVFRFSDDSFETNCQKVSNIFRSFNEKSEIAKLEMKNGIQSFCITCMQLLNNISTTPDSDYMKFRKMLHAHFREMKKVKEYAEALMISEKALNDLVKKHSGMNASSVIYRQITMEAKRLLKTGISIKETAYALNFDDPAHFSKFFKSNSGISPSDFQNNT